MSAAVAAGAVGALVVFSGQMVASNGIWTATCQALKHMCVSVEKVQATYEEVGKESLYD